VIPLYLRQRHPCRLPAEGQWLKQIRVPQVRKPLNSFEYLDSRYAFWRVCLQSQPRNRSLPPVGWSKNPLQSQQISLCDPSIDKSPKFVCHRPSYRRFGQHRSRQRLAAITIVSVVWKCFASAQLDEDVRPSSPCRSAQWSQRIILLNCTHETTIRTRRP